MYFYWYYRDLAGEAPHLPHEAAILITLMLRAGFLYVFSGGLVIAGVPEYTDGNTIDYPRHDEGSNVRFANSFFSDFITGDFKASPRLSLFFGETH